MDGLGAMTEGFHYTACGLDYVYLQNGYKVHDTKHGKGVSVKDAQGLHHAIARAIICSPYHLRGQEVRFNASGYPPASTVLTRSGPMMSGPTFGARP